MVRGAGWHDLRAGWGGVAVRTKYGARRTEYSGQVYASRAEAEYARRLDLLKYAGEIASWARGMRTIVLDGPPGRRVTYCPDFVVVRNDGTRYAVDVKGAVPRDFRIRALLWGRTQPHCPLVVVDVRGNEVDIFARKRAAKARGRKSC